MSPPFLSDLTKIKAETGETKHLEVRMSHCVPNWGVESSPLNIHKPPLGVNVDLVPWFDGRDGGGKAVAVAATARDAVVPCAVLGEDEAEGVQVAPDSEGGCTRVGSCSGPATWEFSRADDDEGSVNADDVRVPVAGEEGWSGEEGGSASLDMSDTCDSIRRVPTMGSSERELSGSWTTSFCSLENSFSSSWRSDTSNTTPFNDNSSSLVLRSGNKRKETIDSKEESNKKENCSKSSTKWSRCKADQSQRKRRGKIDERMKKLQRLVPTSKRQSTEKDKEWVLDEVIEQVQKLQAQLHHHHHHQMMMMSTMMMMPMLQQLPHMPMMMPIPMMMQEGYRQNLAALPACVFPGVHMPAAAYPQCHWRPMSTAEELAHSRMAAASLMQHHQQFPFVFQHGNSL